MSSRSQGFDGDSGASAGACHCSLASDMGRFTNDQFRFDQYLLAEFLRPTNPVQDALRGNSSYVCERWAYRSEPRMAERRELNIVEPMTDTSKGTRNPISSSARMAPMADISLKETSAVKGSPDAWSLLMTG